MQRIAQNTLQVAKGTSNRTGNKYRNTRYGKGSNGQKARHHVKIGFNGSTISFFKRWPKFGSISTKSLELYGVRDFQTLSLSQLMLKFDKLSKLELITDSKNRPVIHTLDLFQTNILHKLHPTAVINGKPLDKPIHLVTNRITEGALENLKNAGGTCTLVYNTKVGLSQLHKNYYIHFLQGQPTPYLLHQLRKFAEVPPNFLVDKYMGSHGYLNTEHRKELPDKGLYVSYLQQHKDAEPVNFLASE